MLAGRGKLGWLGAALALTSAWTWWDRSREAVRGHYQNHQGENSGLIGGSTCGPRDEASQRIASWKAKAEAPAEAIELSRELAELGPAAIPPILTALREADPDLAGALGDALAGIGSFEAVEGLLAATIQTNDENAKIALAESLRNLAKPEGVAALASALSATDDPVILGELCDALGRLAEPKTVEFLAEMYREPERVRGQRSQVIRALRSIENAEATQALVHLMGNAEEPELVNAAAISLAAIGGPYAMDSLTRFLADLPVDAEGRPTLEALLARTMNEAAEGKP